MPDKGLTEECSSTDIAIVGMAGRFPGASNIDVFWKNLINNLETISQFTEVELKAAGENEELLNRPNYVGAKGIIDAVEWFDAHFFGFNAEDARITDPQHRLFLECAWEALESAGYVPEKFNGLIGVYASMADSTYLQRNLLENQKFKRSLDWFNARIATSLTTLSTQVSYRLNLKGPSVNLTTACSSSLVAIAAACRSLIDYDCDMALAGASAIALPQTRGYLFQEGGIESPDGHCRAFDIHSKGTVFSNGVGVIVLKRLQDAIEDGDFIYSVIKSWGINNDGADKAGFAAPSVNGQAQCVATALALANTDAESISYIETHGTGTTVGDPIELKALTHAFEVTTNKKTFCAIGSVKTNIGHTDIASGLPSVMKVAMALKNKIIPATLHYTAENPEIDFANTPFYVNTQLQEWNFGSVPRRAGVNASGIGGTNAFLVLEEYEALAQNSLSRPYQLILLSAKTQTSLQKATQNLRQHLTTIHTSEELANVAFTLQIGRADFNYRQFFVCRDVEDALVIMDEPSSERVFTHQQRSNGAASKITFMFSGQGSQHVGMAIDLYRSEPEFAKWVDTCCNYLEPAIRQAVQAFIFNLDNQDVSLNDTAIVQPVLFIVEYALANLFMSLGVEPDAMIGHSIGEYVAACLAGVMRLEDALYIVCQRGHLMSTASKGVMLAVSLDEQALLHSIEKHAVSLAAVNSATSCVISGEEQAIAELEEKYQQENIITRRLKTSHAFHSHLMEPVLDDFFVVFDGIQLNKPTIPFISNLTGQWITDEQATDPVYWINHLRYTVQFLQGLKLLVDDRYTFFLEVGPGKTLTNFARELIKKNPAVCVQNSLPSVKDSTPPQICFLQALGQLWSYDIKIDWKKFYNDEKRNRVPLPTYSFDRQYYWVESDAQTKDFISDEKKLYPNWFYEPSWERTSFQCASLLPEETFSTPYCWIIFFDGHQMGATIFDVLTQHGQCVISVKSAAVFRQLNDKNYEMNFAQKEDYLNLVKSITKITSLPLCLINLLPLTDEHDMAQLDMAEVERAVAYSFYSVLFFTQAITEQQYGQSVHIVMGGNEIYSVLGDETIYPAKATAIGPSRVIQQEQPLFKIKIVDFLLKDLATIQNRLALSNQLILDAVNMQSDAKENNIAYRNQLRWVQAFRPLTLQTTDQPSRLKEGGVYLFTGGIGWISLTLAKKIAHTVKKARLLFMFRSDFPQQTEWQNWLENHSDTDTISKKIHHLLEIIKLGAEVCLYQVDITHRSQLETAIHAIKKKFSTLSGIIHAAGIAGGGLAQLKTQDMSRLVLAPKVTGTYLLMHLLQKEPLDFIMLCSSISSVLGLASQVDYCAANACLDAFSQLKLFPKNTLCVSISWNTWREVGMSVETDSPTDIFLATQNNSISPIEGATIFIDTLKNPYKHVIVSTVDLNAAMRLHHQSINTDRDSGTLINRENAIGDDADYVPPQGHVEKTLADIWQEILGIDKIGTLDDFFMLGGHSLAALKLLTKIEDKLNIKMNLQALQEAKTIQKMAAVINAAAPKDSTAAKNTTRYSAILVPIRSDGSQQPLFLMHPVSGNIFCYMPLAKYLTFDCPIYGLQDLSLDQGKMIYASIEEMATAYIHAIKEIQPKGPYLLGGLSFGATLSVEIANQLHQQGEHVKPLLLFDGWAKFSEEQHIKKIFVEQMSRLSESKGCDDQFVQLSWARMQMLLDYSIPTTIQAKLILFKAEELLPEYKRVNNIYNHWAQFADKNNIELYITPGNHETILEEPNVITLANTLNTVLHYSAERELSLEMEEEMSR